MSAAPPVLGRSLGYCIGVLTTCLALATGFLLSRCAQSDAAPTASGAVAAPFARTEAALNPEVLTLLADGTKVIGWISGTKEYKGKEVEIWLGEEKKTTTVVAGNHFQLRYKIDKPTKVSAKVGALRETITATPQVKTGPTVFFITDRHVYRPTQTLQFTGFLRQLDANEEWSPLKNTPVKVQLRSTRKNTLAQSFQLTSDELGRIVGSYPFVAADPIDTYELSIEKYEGKATIHLAEYRKAKVQLRIASERKGDRITLRFEALDFMNQPVPARKVAFTANLMRQAPAVAKTELKGSDFVYATTGQALQLRSDALSEDEQLLLQTDSTFQPIVDPELEGRAIATFAGEVDLKGKPTGTYDLTLPQKAPQTGQALVVSAIFTDASGREEHQSKTLPLTNPEEAVQLTVARHLVDVDEVIEVKVARANGKPIEGSATLVAMKLAPTPLGFGLGGIGGLGGLGGIGGLGGLGGGIGGIGGIGVIQGVGGLGGFQNVGGNGLAGIPMVNGRWQKLNAIDPVNRSLITATGFKNDVAKLKLSEAGAYKLIAFVEQPDGSRIRQEVGVIVQPLAKQPGLRLHLDSQTYHTGEELTGTLASRFTGAHVWLTLRDSRGFQWHHTLETDAKGMANFKLRLPADLRYGCVLTAQYSNEESLNGIQVVSQAFHVEPTDRMIKIQTKPSKTVYGPSEKVAVEIQVDRREPVDLVVSVYDKALATLKPTERVDARSFYLADERGQQEQALDYLERRLAGVTLASLRRKARQLAHEAKEDMWQWNNGILNSLKAQKFCHSDLVEILKLAGIDARMGYTVCECPMDRWTVPNPKGTLLEVFRSNQLPYRLHLELLGDTVIVSEYQVDQPLESLRGFNPKFGAGFQGGIGGGFQGGFSLPNNGLGGIAGGLGGFGGIGGIGGGQGAFPGNPPRPVNQGQPTSSSPEGSLVIRRDFSDSAYWNAKLRTDAEGKAHIEFPVPDSLTSWQIDVVAVSARMHIGTGKANFEVSRPIMVGPILPRLFTVGDTVQVSANVLNRSNAEQTLKVRLTTKNGKVLANPEQTLKLAAGKSGFVYWHYEPGEPGITELLMSADCPAGSDASLKRIAVVTPSVEEVTTTSGFCKDSVTIEVPRGFDPKRTQLEVRLAPTLMADLVDTLDYLVDYPYGCVEQTMSRFLPAIKVAQVLQKYDIAHPGLKQKLPGCVRAGIKRLLELQQPDGGWGWNGSSTTHEFMTPYALYGLLEAEKAGYPIGSEQAIQSGLQRLKLYIDNLKDHDTDWLFCVYVYSHRLPIEADWWKRIETLAANDRLSDYALAMALEMAGRDGKIVKTILGRLEARAVIDQDKVSWKTAGFQRWADDPLEITAAVLKALATVDPANKRIPGILQYFNAAKRGNRWNSTRDTAMIVEAMCTYLAQQKLNPAERLRVSFRINEVDLQEANFDNQSLTRKYTVSGDRLKAGVNCIHFTEGTAGAMVRLILRVTKTGKELEPKNSGLQVTRTYWVLDGKGKRLRELKNGETIRAGSYLESEVIVGQKQAERMRYVLVENPRPSSCEVIPEDDLRFNQQTPTAVLREDRETHVAWHHEETPQRFENRCVFHAELPGEFVVGPAVSELMYQTDIRGHSGTFRFRVTED